MNGSVVLVAAIFGLAGVMHFVTPRLFEAIVPPWLPSWLPDARALVIWSGIAELLGAVGVLIPATRAAAGVGLLLLLVAVFPANIHMLLDAQARGAAWWWIAALWIRLPLQPLLMWWVWRVTLRAA